ncbi:MAG: metal ABC transporter ATP-binding protein, partial [Nitrososphaeraceae archaeon]
MNEKKPSEIILTLKNVSFGYNYHLPVIDGITLYIRKGGFIGLLGPSGAGKSTLLKLIVGLYRPWNGIIRFNSFSDKKNKKSKIIGYSPQVESIEWDFPVSVKEFVSLGLWNQSGFFPWINKSTRIEIDHLLHVLGVDGYATRHIKELSGGEQKRVFLARALIHNPEILILDEPTAGLDKTNRENFLQILSDLNLKGMTIIMTT